VLPYPFAVLFTPSVLASTGFSKDADNMKEKKRTDKESREKDRFMAG